jgi:hypothetical protein
MKFSIFIYTFINIFNITYVINDTTQTAVTVKNRNSITNIILDLVI